jgi:hypothetical protein
MSAMRIFSLRHQKVSPSITHGTRRPLAQTAKCAVSLSRAVDAGSGSPVPEPEKVSNPAASASGG